MNLDLEPIIKVFLILLALAAVVGIIGICFGIAAIVTAVKAYFAGKVVKAALIALGILLGVGVLFAYCFFTSPQPTKLVKAILKGNAKKVEKLLKKGADPNEYDFLKEKFPLELAIDRNNAEIVGILLRYKANPDGEPDRYTPFIPLMNAVEQKSEIVKMLVESGANANHGNNFYVNPLEKALVFNRMEMAEILAESGTDLNSTENKREMTVLMSLLERQQRMISGLPDFDSLIEKTRWLIEKGADITVKDYRGKIALDYLHDFYVNEAALLERNDTENLEKYRLLEKLLTIPTPKISEKETHIQEIKRAKITVIAKNTAKPRQDFKAEAHSPLDDMTDDW